MALLKIDEKKKPVVTIVAVLAIAASFISIFITQCERPPKINMKPYLAVGQVAAEETAKLLGNKGKIVIVVQDTSQFKTKNSPSDVQIETFKETIKKQGGISVSGTETVKIDMMAMHGPEMGLPGDLFVKIVQKYPDADAIVSFAGAPQLTDEQISSLGQKIPKFVAVSGMGMMGMGLKKLFEEQVIQLAIVPRFEPAPPSTKKPETLREWFDQTYKVVTAENASTLPF